MVRIAISQAAFDAIAKTLPFGDVGYENKVNERGGLDRAVVDRLRHLRGPGESYSDVIIVLRGVAKSEFSEATRRPASGLRLSIGL
jgi:hypothetical protein